MTPTHEAPTPDEELLSDLRIVASDLRYCANPGSHAWEQAEVCDKAADMLERLAAGRVPMTWPEADALFRRVMGRLPTPDMPTTLHFVRAVEAHHGITSTKERT